MGRKRIALPAMLVLILSLLPLSTGASAFAHAAPALTSRQPVDVRAALASCRGRQGTYRRWLRGWFTPTTTTGPGVDGLLFDGPDAVPLTTVNEANVDSHWTYYGAIYVHIYTRASFGPRWLTLHGQLDCRSVVLWTDRDPFPRHAFSTVYSTPHTAPDGSITTSATAEGLQLTLTVPRGSYPRNALAQVGVSMRNVSGHAIGFWGGGVGLSGVGSPQVEVLDASGRVMFPPAMPYSPPLPGPAPTIATLLPGQTIARHVYIVVRGARIRLSQQFAPQLQPQPVISLPPPTLTTLPITVALSSEPAPTITVHGSGESVSADVTAPLDMTGRPLHLAYADCGFPEYAYTGDWEPAGLHLSPGCSPVRQWHVRLAWLNHPVAALDYTPLSPTPTAVSTPTPVATTITPPADTALFNRILQRANRAMSAVHTLHATGLHQVIDTSHQPALTVQTDCRSSGGTGLPITLRTIRHGANQGPLADVGYLIAGPMIPRPGSVTRTWWRTPATSGRWEPVDLRRQWRTADGVGDPTFGPDPAYINQACPDLIRLTYLAAPLPGLPVPPRVLGMTTLNGHRVWQLREDHGFKLDLVIDAGSYRLLRLRLWDGVAPGNRWQVRIGYSRFNAPVQIALPG